MYDSDRNDEYCDSSMEEILSSIRRYVSDESDDSIYSTIDDNVVNLNEDHLQPSEASGHARADDGLYDNKGDVGDKSIFGKLINAIKKTNSVGERVSTDINDMTIGQLLAVLHLEL